MSVDPIRGIVDELQPVARSELLRVLTSLNDVRTDVIQEFHDRPGGRDMADLLINRSPHQPRGVGWARQAMTQELRKSGVVDE